MHNLNYIYIYATYMYLLPCTCTWQKLKCLSDVTYMPHMLISSCLHMRLLCQYVCLPWTHCNQQYQQELWYTYILHYWHMPPKQICMTHYIFVPMHCYCILYIDPTLLHIYIKTKQQFAALIYHAMATYMMTTNMPSNATHANKFTCRYQTTMSVYIPHYNSVQSTLLPQAFHVIGICPWTYMPGTSDLYLPLH